MIAFAVLPLFGAAISALIALVLYVSGGLILVFGGEPSENYYREQQVRMKQNAGGIVLICIATGCAVLAYELVG